MPNQEVAIKWKNLGGTFRMREGKKIVKPNEVFDAFPHEIPQAFRDCIKPVDAQEPSKADIIQVVSSSYEIKSKGPGLYNVVDGQGKVINEKGLSVQAAKELLETLTD